MTHPLRPIGLLLLLLVVTAGLHAQSVCGEEDPFLVPPSKTFCTDSTGLAEISFNLNNYGDPGNYRVTFPDGVDSVYTGVESVVTIQHALQFDCGSPPGSPALPTEASPYYQYAGALTIVRTDCVDQNGDPQRGSFDFNVIPNPLMELTVSNNLCQTAPLEVDFNAMVCHTNLVDEYRWYIDGTYIGSTASNEWRDFPVAEAGQYRLRVEAHSEKANCGPFFLETSFTVSEAPTIEVDYLYNEEDLCAPEIMITTATSAHNVENIYWTSNSPDVTISDATAASPVITVDNRTGGTRNIVVSGDSPTCGRVTDTFTLVTYVDQHITTARPLTVCAGESFALCEYTDEMPALARVVWSASDVLARITGGTTVCPVVTFGTAGEHELTAVGIDACGQDFTQTLTVSVRDNEGLTIDLAALDTLCNREGDIDLLRYVSPAASVASVAGPGVTGTVFRPGTVAAGDHTLEVADSCGNVYPIAVHVLQEGTFAPGDQVICRGTQLDLVALQAGEYTGPGVVDGIFSPADLADGSYQIAYASRAYCGGAAVFTVTVVPPPVAGFEVLTPVCADAGAGYALGDSLRIAPATTADVQCYRVLETGQERCGADTATFMLAAAGTYTLRQIVSVAGGTCTDTLERQISVIAPLAAELSYELIDRSCDSVTYAFQLTGLPTDLQPQWTDGGYRWAATELRRTYDRPRSDSAAAVRADFGNACFTYTDSVVVDLPRAFQVGFGILNDNRTVCSGDTAFLVNTSVDASDLQFTRADGARESGVPTHLVVHNTTQEVLAYPLRLTGSNPECADQTAVDTLYVLPVTTRAAFSLQYEDQCAPSSVSLVNLSTAGSAGMVYWGDGATPQAVKPGDTLRHAYEVATDTTFEIVLDATLCGTDRSTAHYTVLAPPDAGFALEAPRAGCVGDTLQFLPYARHAGVSMDWDFADGHFSQNAEPQHCYARPGRYAVVLEAVAANGCVSTDTTHVEVKAYSGPALAAEIPEATCVDAPFPVQVAGELAGLAYDYGNGLGGTVPVGRPYTDTGDYQFTLTGYDDAGCHLDTTVRVAVHPSINVRINPGLQDSIVQLGESAQLSFEQFPPRRLDSVAWSGENVDNPAALATTSRPVDDGFYTLLVTDEYGCQATDSVRMTVSHDYFERVYTPTAFSPNGDGNNERFALSAKPNTVRAVRSLRVLARWGQVVYTCTDCAQEEAAPGWDGYIGSEPAQPGVYIWVAEVEFVDGVTQVMRGDVTLLR